MIIFFSSFFQETAGFNYYGTETMYSGTDGVEMTADIFFGIVHYQRLCHMVSDKFQVRNQGPIDQVTIFIYIAIDKRSSICEMKDISNP